AAPLALPTHRPLDSLRRFGTFLRLISSASLLGCQSHPSSVRKCPLIPRGHLAMCPLPVASLITHTSSRRFRPDAYGVAADIVHHLLRPSERWLGVNNPFHFSHWIEITSESLRILECLKQREELQLAGG